MNSVKDFLVVKKAKKILGEDVYSAIQKDFIATFDKVCADISNSDFNAKKILKELKMLKNKIWIEGLFQFLGTSMVGVSLLRQDLYGLQQTIIASLLGVVAIVVSSINAKFSKEELNDCQGSFIEYINKNQTFDIEKVGLNINKSDFEKFSQVAYREASDKLIERTNDVGFIKF